MPQLSTHPSPAAGAARATAGSLFRPEALAQQRVRLWGEVSLCTPASMRWLCAGLVLLTIGVGVFLVLGEYHRKERVRGVLRAADSVALLHAEAPGVIAEVLVHPGVQVRAGQPLVRLAGASQLPDGRAASALVAAELDRQLAALASERAREQARDALQRRSLESRIANLGQDIALLAGSLERQHQLEAIGREQLSRIEVLVQAGQVARAQLATAQAEQLQRTQLWVEAQRAWRARSAERTAAQLELQRAPLEREARLAALEQRASDLRQRKLDVLGARAASVTAPFEGVVGDVYVAVGEQVQREAALLSVARARVAPAAGVRADAVNAGAASQVEAVLLVPSRAAGFIRPGQAVRMRYEAFPYQRFGSHLAVVSNVDTALLLPGDVDLPLVVQEPVLRVRARPARDFVLAYGQRIPLRPGLAFDADVLLERRTLLQWLFDPLRAQLGQ